MSRAFQIDPRDTVATLLAPATSQVELFGAKTGQLKLAAPIERGHKVALVPVEAGECVLKYGVPIGRATVDILAGEWVHLHNLASDYDARSATLDLQTGAPTDTASAYE